MSKPSSNSIPSSDTRYSMYQSPVRHWCTSCRIIGLGTSFNRDIYTEDLQRPNSKQIKKKKSNTIPRTRDPKFKRALNRQLEVKKGDSSMPPTQKRPESEFRELIGLTCDVNFPRISRPPEIHVTVKIKPSTTTEPPVRHPPHAIVIQKVQRRKTMELRHKNANQTTAKARFPTARTET